MESQLQSYFGKRSGCNNYFFVQLSGSCVSILRGWNFSFFVKPIEEDKFNDAIDAFVSNLEEKEEVLTVRVDGMTHFIKAQSISYVEDMGSIVSFIWLTRRKWSVTKRLQQWKND